MTEAPHVDRPANGHADARPDLRVERRGLAVRPVFSTPGVHPYDEVAWELRDVVQTNWRTGATVFEQHGVEFPGFWSANASTIVTTKYFRGAVGTPQRERSLRQLIDRVVGAYVRAGREHGYFATPSDAETFGHELTWMLLHQVFSFNSPVWFNVGTEAPQQVSACQPWDALVSTPDGLVPIGALVDDGAVGAKVYDAHGVTTVVATKDNGVKRVLRLHLKSGHALDVTPDHLVWRSTGDGTGRFVEAGTLRPGDQLEWHRRTSFGEAEITSREVAEAALAGWLQSDGFVGRYAGTNRSLTIEAMTVTGAERAWVLRALDVVLPGVHRHERRVATQDTALDCRRTRLYGEVLRPFVEEWDLLARGRDMRVPDRLFTAPLPVAAAYLRSIFQAEGYVSARTSSTLLGLAMVGEELVRGVQQLLGRFGIFARVGFARDDRPGRQGGIWTLRIQNAGDRRTFADEIGFVDPAKAEKLERSFELPGRAALPVKRLEIARVEDRGEMRVYDIQTESGEYLSGGLRVHNCFILAVDDTMESILNWYREEGLIFKGGSGSGINLSRIRSSKELLSSGGTASGPVSFMRGADASAGTIKSGGATRRAAKMVVLDVDHPDIQEFVDTKVREEEKIRVLRDAGFDMDLGGRDITSVQYQNANNSVRVTDEFMRAVEGGGQFGLRARTSGEVLETVDAKRLFRSMAEAAWACADPGIQYDDTINDWHTNPESGRITASNPCFTGDTLVETDEGLLPISLLAKRFENGDSLVVRAWDEARSCLSFAPVTRAWMTKRTDDLLEVAAASGLRVTCTPDHRFLVEGRGWVAAQGLSSDDRIVATEGASVAVVSVTRVRPDDQVPVYDLAVEGLHTFVVGAPGIAGLVVHNCSEYMSLDNSSCNLASLNLLKFLTDADTFDAERFARAVETVVTAMDISICFADFPTEAIGETTRAYRQLGIGYANLGALLMACGLAYDSDGGRALAAAITALMTGTAYRRSAELAGVVGPYEGFARNAEAHARVMRKHAAAADAVRPVSALDGDVLRLAARTWAEGNRTGEANGWRNAQASVLAPTGCLTADTLVSTGHGLLRLAELGDVWGDRWQRLGVPVMTDDGERTATEFFVNGEEPTRRVVTAGGYRIQGTLGHRIKVVDPASGEWVWKRLSDVAAGDVVPLQMGELAGRPRRVPLPVLDQAYYAGDRHTTVPDAVGADLAELVGYFMGDGSLHAKGVRLCVADADLDVLERIRILAKGLFHLEPRVTQRQGYHEVVLQSVGLARWWEAAGFAKSLPRADHSGKGWTPHVPTAIRETNDPEVYAAFLRGLFEADGSVTAGVPCMSTASARFAEDVRTLLLLLGVATTTDRIAGAGGDRHRLRVREGHAGTFAGRVGLLGTSTSTALEHAACAQPHAGAGLGYLFEEVAANEDGGVQPTYDLSVPSNVTYVANGFVSHNTIGFMMDCDTTGIEPDFSLVKFKKLVGGGSMQIVNQTIPRALVRLGYTPETVEAVVEYIAAHGHVVDAPGLRPEHHPVFDCAMGERSISPMGHVRMMAAVQPFLSGSISKTVNIPESATIEDVEQVYLEGWRLGLKALAVYRDNCKVGQPLSDGRAKKADKAQAAPAAVEHRPVRRRLPKKRPSVTTSFSVAGAEGYMTAGSYPDDGLGEVFLKLGKQGSTLSGVMDAFSIAISIALQYGVPLEAYVSKFVNMRFEPAGMTDDRDVRMAQSFMDYIFRRLALDYLPYETRAGLGIFTAEERARALAEGADDAPASAPDLGDDVVGPGRGAAAPGQAVDAVAATAHAAPADVHSSVELLEVLTGTASDAPLCMTCGTRMRPAGSCYVCEGCGSTSGCS